MFIAEIFKKELMVLLSIIYYIDAKLEFGFLSVKMIYFFVEYWSP